MKDKFEFHLKRLKEELIGNKQFYLSVCSILEKIITNVIENPGNEKFYQIKHVII
jgi:hypothetical protein